MAKIKQQYAVTNCICILLDIVHYLAGDGGPAAAGQRGCEDDEN